MPEVNDRRDWKTRETHTCLIGGRDKILSGWGPGKGGAWAYWACKPEHAEQVEAWVKSRGDIGRLTPYDYKRPCGHVSIYVVRDGHPALINS